jgi:hypothetical protein
MNKHVTKQQSIKLKELGFDVESKFFYHKDRKHILTVYNLKVLQKQTKTFISTDILYPAPTLNEAKDWIWEKFGIFIEIRYFSDTFLYYIHHTKISIASKAPPVGMFYKTPYLALTAGINKAIEIIKEETK